MGHDFTRFLFWFIYSTFTDETSYSKSLSATNEPYIDPKTRSDSFPIGILSLFSFLCLADCTITLVELSTYGRFFSVTMFFGSQSTSPSVRTMRVHVSNYSSVGTVGVEYMADTFVENGTNILSW